MSDRQTVAPGSGTAASEFAGGDRKRPLPYIDEHTIDIEADAIAVWPALTEVVARSFSGTGSTLLARALGCADCAASQTDMLIAGSTMPGFRVIETIPGQRLALAGHHRFSRYSLGFRIREIDHRRVNLSAETRAAFPGLLGTGYRALVIGSGGHVIVVRRLLAAVKRRAQQPR
jgi:hypothetical protein